MNRRQDARREDIAQLAFLIVQGFHNPKQFNRAVEKYTATPQRTAVERQKIEQESKAIGSRGPLKG